MAAAKAAAPAAPPPICHGQVADAGCGAAFDVKAGVPTPKTWASPANAACPDTKSPWTHWGGNWWKNENGGWKEMATSPYAIK
jgi:hypothetical protein